MSCCVAFAEASLRWALASAGTDSRVPPAASAMNRESGRACIIGGSVGGVAASVATARTGAVHEWKGPGMPGPFLEQSVIALPDHDALVLRADHRVTGLALERGRERRHVRGRADRAELRRRMRIGVQPHLEFVRGEVAAPHRGPVDEEALVLGVAVDLLPAFATGILERLLQGVVGHGQAAEVGDVLAPGQLA